MYNIFCFLKESYLHRTLSSQVFCWSIAQKTDLTTPPKGKKKKKNTSDFEGQVLVRKKGECWSQTLFLCKEKLPSVLYFSYLQTVFLSWFFFLINAFRGRWYFTFRCLVLSLTAACRNILKSVSCGSQHLLFSLDQQELEACSTYRIRSLRYQGLTVIIRTRNLLCQTIKSIRKQIIYTSLQYGS